LGSMSTSSSSVPVPVSIRCAIEHSAANLSDNVGSMARRAKRVFDAHAFLNAPGMSKRIVEYPTGAAVFTQGDPCDTIFYVRHGSVKLAVVSRSGKEAVVGVVGPGDFFGEGAL